MKNLAHVGLVAFPPPQGININMMPFVMNRPKSIPLEYRHYWPLIEACNVESFEREHVGYLSIREGLVPKGKSQGRPGIHTEGHANLSWGGGTKGGWGKGSRSEYGRYGGLYMASTVTGSCQAWDVHVDAPGHMGDCEVLRFALTREPLIEMRAGELWWMTDRCPHESMPMLIDGVYRQWFRLVTHHVDAWYAAHSTPNPLGVEPLGQVIKEDKFS